jgi:hypothetical protein
MVRNEVRIWNPSLHVNIIRDQQGSRNQTETVALSIKPARFRWRKRGKMEKYDGVQNTHREVFRDTGKEKAVYCSATLKKAVQMEKPFG